MAAAQVIVRVATPADVGRIQAFYATQAARRVDPGERFVIAEADGEIVGAVRLCREQGHLVLRTMQIAEAYRRRGIGARMLRTLEPLMEDAPCYCLPYTHLPAFYATIGFRVIPAEQAPPHLQTRYRHGLAQGISFLVMARPAGPPVARREAE